MAVYRRRRSPILRAGSRGDEDPMPCPYIYSSPLPRCACSVDFPGSGRKLVWLGPLACPVVRCCSQCSTHRVKRGKYHSKPGTTSKSGYRSQVNQGLSRTTQVCARFDEFDEDERRKHLDTWWTFSWSFEKFIYNRKNRQEDLDLLPSNQPLVLI
ncbi:hypothetical protein BDV19DRAFT_336933 [Aspergillus venezuelensis]